MSVNVCLVSDENYVSYMCVTIASIACNTTSSVKFFILHRGISSGTQEIIRDWIGLDFGHCSIKFCDIEERLKHINMNFIRHFNHLVFGRYFFADCFPDVEKVVYVDSDVIALDDIGLLYNLDLNKFCIGATKEFWLEDKTSGNKIKNNISPLQLSTEHTYFSSGVLLIDCKKWRSESFADQLLRLYDSYRDFSQYPDQDPLNKLFENNYLSLPPIFNMSEVATNYLYSQKLNNVEDGIVIYHFSGDAKPWNQLMNNNRFFDWWFYASKTPFYFALKNRMIEKTIIDKMNQICSRDSVFLSSKLCLRYLKRYLKYALLSKILWGERKRHYERKLWRCRHLKLEDIK